MKLKLPYPPEAVASFFLYDYEFIDCYGFMRDPRECLENYAAYEAAVRTRFSARVPVDKMPSIPINALWLPPFVLAAVLKDGIAQYERRQGISFDYEPDAPLDKRWTLGCVLFHLKDSEYTGGSSLLLSPFELDIPLYGL